MKIALNLQKIRPHSAYKGSIKIRIKIGESLVMVTQRAFLRKGVYCFLQKHIVKLDYNDSSYVHLCLVSETNHILAQITVFFGKFKTKQHLTLQGQEGSKYEINYVLEELEQEKNSQMKMQKLKSKSFLDDDPEFLKEAFGKPQILRMGVLVYNFAQRLDPVVYSYAKARYVLYWKNPMLTLGVGILLTLILLNLKMSILLGGVLLFCCRDILFKKFQKAEKYKDISNRLMVPDQNVFLVQEMMDNYCSAFEWATGFIFGRDKTLLVNAVKILCKMGVVLILLLFLFDLEHLMVIGLWTALLMTSPINTFLGKIFRPAVVTFVSEYAKIMDKITMEIKSMIYASAVKKEPNDTLREFYVYHYERWNLFSGWGEDSMKFSDKDGQCECTMQRKAPHGWQWINNWELDTSDECDEFGYQYSNDFLNYFISSLFLANKRRRKWRRRCVRVNNPEK